MRADECPDCKHVDVVRPDGSRMKTITNLCARHAKPCQAQVVAYGEKIVHCVYLTGHDHAHQGRDPGYENIHWVDRDVNAIGKDHLGEMSVPLSWCKTCGDRIEFFNGCWWTMNTCKTACGDGPSSVYKLHQPQQRHDVPTHISDPVTKVRRKSEAARSVFGNA